MRKTIKVPRRQYRSFTLERAERQDGDDGSGDLYPLTMSSEIPVRRWAWDIGEYWEVLSHAPGDVDLSRAAGGLPALKSHTRLLQVGSVSAVKLDESARVTRGLLGFSSIDVGREQKTLVDEGHLRTVSIGYETTSMELVGKDENDIPTYRSAWLLYELSTEPVPADAGVGFGRGSADDQQGEGVELKAVEVEVLDVTAGGERSMAQELKKEIAPATPEAPEKVSVPTPDTGDARAAQAAEIVELCSTHKVPFDRATKWIREGATPAQVSRTILDMIATEGPGQPPPPSEALDAMPEKDVRAYSVQRVLRIAAGDEKPTGLEAEVHEELARSHAPAHGGFLIPWRLRKDDRLSGYHERVLGTGEAAGGATLVDTQKMPDMIDILRNRAMCLQLGARFYPGLQGVVQFNKKTGAPTVYWMEENPAAAVTGSEPSYGYVTMSPKTVIASVQVPRQLLTTAGIDVEADIRSEIGVGHALLFDLAALHGTGTDKQPVGIYSAADVLAHAAGGVPDFADIGTMIGLLADANADLGALAWITTPLMASLMSRTVLVSGHPKFLWEGTIQEGTMLGYRAVATNQVSKTLEGAAKHGLIFGNWNDLMLGVWGNDLEITVDNLTRATYGQIVITSYSMADVAIRRGQSFCKATGATIV